MSSSFLLVELLHSGIARDQRQKDTLRGLGLRHRHQKRVLLDTPEIRGLIKKVFDLVSFKEVNTREIPKAPKIETYRLGPVPTERKEKAKKVKPAPQAKADGGDAKSAGAKGKAEKKSDKKPAAGKKASAAKSSRAK